MATKLEKIASSLEAISKRSPYPFKVWGMQDILDLAKSGIKGDISDKTARKLIYEHCTEYLDSGCYDSAHLNISAMCLPIVWN
jgi:hypothetical protein